VLSCPKSLPQNGFSSFLPSPSINICLKFMQICTYLFTKQCLQSTYI
jgi:hypothetical protein